SRCLRFFTVPVHSDCFTLSLHDALPIFLIFGKHGHAEVIGLQGQTNNEALVFQDIDELNGVELPSSFTLYSQTTKSVDKFYAIKDRKSTRLNSSHVKISYAVFCLKKKTL